MKMFVSAVVALLVAGCASNGQGPATFDLMDEALSKAGQPRPEQKSSPDALTQAVMPPLVPSVPTVAEPREPRFDLSVNNAPVQQVMLGIVEGTRFSMLLHPEVAGNITLALKGVTVIEALDALRELYGYEYRIEGAHITIQPNTLRTQLFGVNYPTGVRQSSTELRVTSGSVTENVSSGSGSSGTSTSGGTVSGSQSSKVSTLQLSDFWQEVASSVGGIVGCAVQSQPATNGQAGTTTITCQGGRHVTISPQAAIVAVRAFPPELRAVSDFLKKAQLSAERQVMIEAKIIEVSLSDSHQAGINWANFRNLANKSLSVGMVSPGVAIGTSGAITLPGLLSSAAGTDLMGSASAPAGVFGLSFRSASFAALLAFLETQGTTQVLSSPRIAAINNQKAILKVGVDQFFVTNVSVSTTTATGGGTGTSTPTVELQPFFSGIALDVTPQIDEHDNIILHVRPSVSKVETVSTTIQFGATVGDLILPLAQSSVSETDSIVRLRDGDIGVIGGLMTGVRHEGNDGVVGASDIPIVGALFRNVNQRAEKHELVILLKPTIIKGADQWQQDIRDTHERVLGMGRGYSLGGKPQVMGMGRDLPN